MKKITILLLTLLLCFSLSSGAMAYTLSGNVSGGVFLGGITYVIAVSLDFSTIPPDMYIGLVLLGVGNYSVQNVPEGDYILFAFQDRDNNMTPSAEDYFGFYGGQLPEVLTVTGNMSGLNITIAPLPETTIEGTLTYGGSFTGLTLFEAATDPNFLNVAHYSILFDSTGSGDYTIFVEPGIYYIRAYIDLDFSFSYSAEEPGGYYGYPGAPQAVNVTGSSATGINFTMFDPVTPNFTVDLTPVNPPIIIPANGGAFSFNITIVNNGSSAMTVDAWTNVLLPDSTVYGPIILRTLVMQSGGQISRNLSQSVPASAPPGVYTYRAFVGDYPDVIYAQDSFIFQKIHNGGMSYGNFGGDNWGISGWEGESGANWTQPASFSTISASPNPFNPRTQIGFRLEKSGRIEVGVYDLRGRIAGELFEGGAEAGDYSIPFDGSGLTSGVYFLRVAADNQVETVKLMLLK